MHGYACCSCGVECSGMGSCDSCNGALCFFCAKFSGEGRERRTFCPEHFPKECSAPGPTFLTWALEAHGCLEDTCGHITVWNPVKNGYVRGIGFCRFSERRHV